MSSNSISTGAGVMNINCEAFPGPGCKAEQFSLTSSLMVIVCVPACQDRGRGVRSEEEVNRNKNTLGGVVSGWVGQEPHGLP